jgi:hypothetical protein
MPFFSQNKNNWRGPIKTLDPNQLRDEKYNARPRLLDSTGNNISNDPHSSAVRFGNLGAEGGSSPVLYSRIPPLTFDPRIVPFLPAKLKEPLPLSCDSHAQGHKRAAPTSMSACPALLPPTVAALLDQTSCQPPAYPITLLPFLPSLPPAVPPPWAVSSASALLLHLLRP